MGFFPRVSPWAILVPSLREEVFCPLPLPSARMKEPMPETARTFEPPFTDVPGALAEVRAGPRTPHGLGLVRSVVVELREPLAEIESFTLVCQDGLTLPTIAIAARAMRDALSGWSTTRPLPLPIQVEPRGGP